MIPKRYEMITFAFFMSLLMSCIMSFFITVVNIGFTNDLLWRWLHAWGIAWAIAFPLALFVVPAVRRIVHRLVSAD